MQLKIRLICLDLKSASQKWINKTFSDHLHVLSQISSPTLVNTNMLSWLQVKPCQHVVFVLTVRWVWFDRVFNDTFVVYRQIDENVIVDDGFGRTRSWNFSWRRCNVGVEKVGKNGKPV